MYFWNLCFKVDSGQSQRNKVGTGMEIVKCISLPHNIIKDVEGLHDSLSKDCGSLDANDGTQFKKSMLHNSATTSGRQT
jgi:hypothetical protein